MAIPTKDALLVPFSTNFDARINQSPATFALSAAQATAYTAVHDPYVAAYQAVVDAKAAGNRLRSLTNTKDTTRLALLYYARQLYTTVQASKEVTDANKILLDVHVREDVARPVPAPSDRPSVSVVGVVGRTVAIDIRATADTTKRAKPTGAEAAWVYTYVGNDYPTDPSAWAFQGAATKSKFDVVFADNVANGAQVWICAVWINRRQESGPISTPVTTNIQGGGMAQQTTGVRLAA